MSNNSEFMWRLSKGAYNVACIEGEQGRVNKKKELIFAGKDAALAALKLDNSCAEAHKWLVIFYYRLLQSLLSSRSFRKKSHIYLVTALGNDNLISL